MKRFKNFIVLLLGTALFTVSCVKEDVNEDISTFQTESKPIIEATLHGQVLDDNNRPIQNAEVVFKSGENEITLQTDEYGMFLFENVLNRGQSAYLTVSSNGKFDAFRRFGVLPNRHNYTVIKMNEKDIDGRIEASEGGTIENVDGAKVTLPPNGIIDANGNSYNGTVHVAMAWINPDGEDLSQRMVGDLSGIDETGRTRALMTYGMLQVELLDDSGNELNLSSNHEAKLSFPIPQAMINNAKAEIPLWIYDEEIGTWIYEGVAKLDEGAYVGNVPHFSSFNVDFMTDPIEIIGQVKIENELDNIKDTSDASYFQVYVCSENIGKKGGYLCDDGSFRFYNFPKNESFTLKVLNDCGDVIYEKEYGPYSESTDLGCILVPPSSSMVNVTGKAVDCSGQAIENGIFYLVLDNRKLQFPVAEDGSISFVADLCTQTEGEFYVIDTDQLLQSNAISVDLTTSVVDLGTIELCDQITELIEFEVSDGTTGFLTPNVNFYIGQSEANIGATDTLGGNGALFQLKLNTSDLPTSPSSNFTVLSSAFQYSSGRSDYYYSGTGDITVSFDEYNTDQGGRMRGSFSGITYSEFDSLSATLDIMGRFDFTVK